MKRITAMKLSLSMLSGLVIGGCASTDGNTQIEFNQRQAKNNAPIRLVVDATFSSENERKLIEEWAGVAGKSTINGTSHRNALRKIKQKCGFGRSKLIEKRIVNYQENSWEEVWLFKDAASLRDDKVSGLTVLFEYDAAKDKSSIALFGECHTAKGESIIISKQ